MDEVILFLKSQYQMFENLPRGRFGYGDLDPDQAKSFLLQEIDNMVENRLNSDYGLKINTYGNSFIRGKW